MVDVEIWGEYDVEWKNVLEEENVCCVYFNSYGIVLIFFVRFNNWVKF